MQILLCTIDLHGYDDAYRRAVSALGFEVEGYTGLRRYHFRTRARRLMNVRVPNMLGAERDREWGERRKLRKHVLGRDLSSVLVLFVNGQQLATSELLEDIRRAGGKSALWLLDETITLPTTELDLSSFDFLASFDPRDALNLRTESGHPCSFIPQGFDDSVQINGPERSRDTSLLFVASPGERRQAVVRQLVENHVPLELVGHYWPQVIEEGPGVRIVPRDADRLEANRMYANARPCLNIHYSPTSGVNPRTFEVAGAGGLLISDNSAVGEFFDPGTEALLWSDVGEIVEYAGRIRTDRAWAQSIAAAGLRRAHADHSLRKRFSTMFTDWGIVQPSTRTDAPKET